MDEKERETLEHEVEVEGGVLFSSFWRKELLGLSNEPKTGDTSQTFMKTLVEPSLWAICRERPTDLRLADGLAVSMAVCLSYI
jgi:hypothetical protein